MKKLFPLIIYHTIFLIAFAVLRYFVLQFFDIKPLEKFEENTFYFFVIFSCFLLQIIFLIYHNIPKARTMLLLASFFVKFLIAGAFFLVHVVKYETLLKSNSIFAVSLFIVNYFIFTIWIIFIYFKLNKKYID